MRDKDMLRVSTWKFQAIGWTGLVFFSFCLVMSWISGQRNASPWFLPFILMSLPVLLLSGPVYATTEAIAMRCPAGTFRIAWGEIKRVEFGQCSMVLFGESKRLPMPGPSFWSGADKSQIGKLMETFCHEDQVEIARTFRADYLFPKNTKVAKVGLTRRSTE